MGTTTNFQLPYPTSSDTVDVPQDFQDLAVATDAVLGATANEDVFSSIGGCSLGTTSASYVDITGASKAFTKVGGAADSDLIVLISLSGFVTVGGTGFKVGVQVNGVDRDATYMLMNSANTHIPLPMGAVRITGLAAGAYTVKARALRTTGTGTLTVDPSDSVTMVIKERAI